MNTIHTMGIGAWVFSIVLAALRIAGVKHEAFQAIAHLWVGALIYAWMFDDIRLAKWMTIGLTIVELCCFVYFKVMK